MNNKPTIQNIRCCVIHYLNHREQVSFFHVNPLVFLWNSTVYMTYHMSNFLNLHEKLRLDSFRVNEVSEAPESKCWPDFMHHLIYRGSESESYRQAIKRDLFIKNYIQNMLVMERNNLLSKSQIEWIKRDRSQIYILMTAIEKQIKENSKKMPLDKKLKGIAKLTLQPNGVIKLSRVSEQKNLWQDECIYLNGANFNQLSLLTTEEVYLNLLLLLDNTFYIHSSSNRNNFIVDLKDEYMNIMEKVKKIQKLITRQKISVNWIYGYFLKKTPKDIVSPYNISNTPDKHYLDCLIYHFFKNFKGNTKEFEARVSKAWSEKKIRDRKSKQKKTIILSQKDFDDLNEISKKVGKTQKDVIKVLIRQEKQRLAVYGVLK